MKLYNGKKVYLYNFLLLYNYKSITVLSERRFVWIYEIQKREKGVSGSPKKRKTKTTEAEEQQQLYKELSDSGEKPSNSEPENFYVKEDLYGKNWVNPGENTKKLGLMNEILGENITLQDGESRSNKLYRLAYIFSELLEVIAEKISRFN